MSAEELFEHECHEEILRQGSHDKLRQLSSAWLNIAAATKYSYHFRALGRPIIQYPQDILAVQELIWAIKPTLIIETGVAHGGSLVMSAAMLALLDYADAADGAGVLDIRNCRRRVVGIDIDLRSHNRAAIEAHPLHHKIEIMQGSSVDPVIIKKVHSRVTAHDRVLIMLDSNHTHDHVFAELEAYAPLTSPGSYCVVFDTLIEDLPKDSFGDRPWNIGNNPKTAVRSYLELIEKAKPNGADAKPLRFEIDRNIEHKLLLTAAPDGYLRRMD